jgi:hypothetical protein
MVRLSLNVTPELERDLDRFMKQEGIRRKSEAIRRAVHDAAARSIPPACDYSSWLGLGLREPLNSAPRLRSEDDLWS